MRSQTIIPDDDDPPLGMNRQNFDRFMDAQVQSQQLSDGTKRKYVGAINRLEGWLPDDVEDPGVDDFKDFILTLSATDELAGATLNVYKCAIKKYLVAHNRSEDYPPLKIWFAENFRATSASTYDYLDEEETTAFFDACEDPQERAAVGIMLATGIRVSELVDIDVSDVDLDAGTVTVGRAKRREVRSGPGDERSREVTTTRTLPEKHRRAVAEYLSVRDDYGPEDGSPGDALLITPVPSGDGSYRMSTETVRNRFNDIACRCPHPDVTKARVHPHLLRHTVGTRLGEQGYTAEQIAEFLAQGDSESATRYTHASEEQIEEMSAALV